MSETAALYSVYGPCGRERQIAEKISDLVKPFADQVSTDRMGNLLAVRKGTSGKTVLISCPMDRPGLAVVDYGERYLRGDFVGDLRFENVHQQKAMFDDGSEFPVLNTAEDGTKLFETSVGIDLENAPDKEKYMKTAQFVMLKSPYKEDANSVEGFGVGVTACCEALLEVSRKLETKHTVVLAFTSMTQIEDKSIGCALYEVKPDAWIELRPVPTETGKVEAGNGPVAELPMMRRRGEPSPLDGLAGVPVQYVMMNRQLKNPIFGYKRDHFGYARYFSLGLPVTAQATENEKCLRCDMDAAAKAIRELLERI